MFFKFTFSLPHFLGWNTMAAPYFREPNTLRYETQGENGIKFSGCFCWRECPWLLSHSSPAPAEVLFYLPPEKNKQPWARQCGSWQLQFCMGVTRVIETVSHSVLLGSLHSRLSIIIALLVLNPLPPQELWGLWTTFCDLQNVREEWHGVCKL